MDSVIALPVVLSSVLALPAAIVSEPFPRVLLPLPRLSVPPLNLVPPV